jgi:hypothetical protein
MAVLFCLLFRNNPLQLLLLIPKLFFSNFFKGFLFHSSVELSIPGNTLVSSVMKKSSKHKESPEADKDYFLVPVHFIDLTFYQLPKNIQTIWDRIHNVSFSL